MVSPGSTTAGLIDQSQAFEALQALESFIGEKFVSETVGYYRNRMATAKNDVDRLCWVEALHPLAPALADYLAVKKSGVVGPVSERFAQLAADAYALFMHETSWKLDPTGPGGLYLKKRLKNKSDAMQCLYEFRMASFFKLQGFPVTIRSGRPHEGHDLEVTAGGVAVEVECKYMHPWAGQKIHNPTFNKLFNTVRDRLASASLPAASVAVTCADHLDEEHLDEIVVAIVQMVLTGQSRKRVQNHYQIDVSVLGKKPHRVLNSVLDGELASLRQLHPGAHVGLVARGDSAHTNLSLLLAATSSQSDDAVGNFVRTAVRASKQLSGTKPGVVTIHLPENTLDQPLPTQESPFVRAFGTAVIRGRLGRAGLTILTTEGNFVRDGTLRFGGHLFGLRNRQAPVQVPDAFPGMFSRT